MARRIFPKEIELLLTIERSARRAAYAEYGVSQRLDALLKNIRRLDTWRKINHVSGNPK